MKTTSVRFPPEELESLTEEAEEEGYSRGEYLRVLMRIGREHRGHTNELERVREQIGRLRREHEDELAEAQSKGSEKQRERIAELEAQVEEAEESARREHQAYRNLLAERTEHKELVAAQQEQASLAKRRSQAGWWTKLKWSALGMPDED